MSLSCGFATNSTIPENAKDAVTSRRCTNFRQPVVRIAALIANRSGCCGALINRKGCDRRPLCWARLQALRLHLPFGSEAFWVLLALSQETR
jgi:hypothetical protein